MFDQREELPLLPFGYPIGFVPASRGGVNLKSNIEVLVQRFENRVQDRICIRVFFYCRNEGGKSTRKTTRVWN